MIGIDISLTEHVLAETVLKMEVSLMKVIQFLLVALVCSLCACSPLQRGFDGAALVSPARPEVMLTVPELPVLAKGQITPFLYTDRGYQFPTTILSVYGKDAASPMAITVLSFVPDELWEWDSAEFSGPHGAKTAGAMLGGRAFYGTVRIVNGEKDPFSPLVADEEQFAAINWMAQRFVLLEDFRSAKIILEYREPLPESLSGATELQPANEKVQAFTERAARAFQAQFGSEEGALPRPEVPAYLNSLNGKYLGAFLGSMSAKEIWSDMD